MTTRGRFGAPSSLGDDRNAPSIRRNAGLHRCLHHVPPSMPIHGDEPLPGDGRGACIQGSLHSHDRMCGDLPDSSDLHAPGISPSQAYVPGMRRDLRGMRQRLRAPGWHAGVRRCLQGLCRILPPDGGVNSGRAMLPGLFLPGAQLLHFLDALRPGALDIVEDRLDLLFRKLSSESGHVRFVSRR